MTALAPVDATNQWAELVVPGRLLSHNEERRSHWSHRARYTRGLREAVAMQAMVARLPKGLAVVTVTAQARQAKGARLADRLAYAPTVKAAIDGLVDYGLVADDDQGHMDLRVAPNVRSDDGRPYLALLVEWNAPGA